MKKKERKLERPKKIWRGDREEVRRGDNSSLIRDPKSESWRTQWMYTDRADGTWIPFKHESTEEKAKYIEIECDMPRNACHHDFAKYFPQRVRIATDGGLIVAHAILFPDGRRWDAYNRRFEQAYEPWEGYDQQPEG